MARYSGRKALKKRTLLCLVCYTGLSKAAITLKIKGRKVSPLLRTSWVVFASLAVSLAMADVTIAPDVTDALSAGRARVVVELTLAREFTPEGRLSAQLAREQRAAIAAAQQAVLDALDATDTRLVRRPTTVPFLALEIGPDALPALNALSSHISRILLDSTATANPNNESQGALP